MGPRSREPAEAKDALVDVRRAISTFFRVSSRSRIALFVQCRGATWRAIFMFLAIDGPEVHRIGQQRGFEGHTWQGELQGARYLADAPCRSALRFGSE